jgi:hypothetical protein
VRSFPQLYQTSISFTHDRKTGKPLLIRPSKTVIQIEPLYFWRFGKREFINHDIFVNNAFANEKGSQLYLTHIGLETRLKSGELWDGNEIFMSEVAETYTFYDITLMDMDTHQIIDRRQESIKINSPFLPTTLSASDNAEEIDIENKPSQWLRSETAHKLAGVYEDGKIHVWEWDRAVYSMLETHDSLDDLVIGPFDAEVPEEDPVFTLTLMKSLFVHSSHPTMTNILPLLMIKSYRFLIV